MTDNLGGRPKIETPCPYCAQLFGAREFRNHIPRCKKNPNRKMPATTGIYLMTSNIGGIQYIGGSTDCQERRWKHESDLRRGVHTYTKEFLPALEANQLSFSLLESCSVEELATREQYWMDQFPDRINKSRFVTTREYTASEETRRKLSISKLGTQYALGHKVSQEARLKISLANKGRKLSEEHRVKVSKSLTGHKTSEETRRKISQSLKGHGFSPESIAKMTATRRRMSAENAERKRAKRAMGATA